jgi:hypothetical protein
VEDDDDTGHVEEEGGGALTQEARGEICPLTFLVGRILWKKYAL